MQDLIDKIKAAISLTPEAEKHIFSIANKKQVSKGTLLIRQGQYVEKTYFVTSGALCSYCTDTDGKQHTLQFAIKDWWISDFMALYGNEPASLTVECITNATVIEFNAKDLNAVFTLYPEFETFQRKNLERHVVSLHKRILNQLQLSALERYNLFLKQYPNIEKHVPNYQIASYLGITQQSLSRIRIDKVKQKKEPPQST